MASVGGTVAPPTPAIGADQHRAHIQRRPAASGTSARTRSMTADDHRRELRGIRLQHAEQARALAHARDVPVHAEDVDAAVGPPIGLETLETGARVVQHVRRGRQLDRPGLLELVRRPFAVAPVRDRHRRRHHGAECGAGGRGIHGSCLCRTCAFIGGSVLDEDRGGMLEAFLQRLDHRGGVEAVDEAMIERRREIHDAADRDRALDHDRPLDRFVDADDRDFRCVDDRRRGDAAEPTEARDRDGGARSVHRASPCCFLAASDDAADLGCEIRERPLLRVTHDRHLQSVRRLRCDADVHARGGVGSRCVRRRGRALHCGKISSTRTSAATRNGR